LQFLESESQEGKRKTQSRKQKHERVLKKEKVMKKVIGVALVSAVLAAMLPASASAFNPINNSKNCKATWLRPCPNTMPPASTGGNGGFTRGGGSGSSGSGSGTSTRGGGINTRPAVPPTH
jgi:uncharacterized membrane protein YgcG